MKSFILLFLFYSINSYAIEFTWFGTTNIVIRTPESTLMFDPFITHPNLIASILFKKVDSDEKLVRKWALEANLKKVDSVFISHSHYDHILDLGSVMKIYKAKMYGSESAVNFALGQGASREVVNQVKINKDFELLNMKVLPVEVAHSEHFLGHVFMKGQIDSPLKLPANMWKIKDGKNLIYHLKFPDKKILFHPAGRKSPFFEDYKKLKAEILFIGVAKRISTLDQLEKIILPVNPKIIIPLHFDNFLSDLTKNPDHLPGINLDEWEKTIKSKLPGVRIIRPKVAQWINISE